MNNFSSDRFQNISVSGWIQQLESSDSRIHKETTIEKALVAAKIGDASAEAFLFNCYQAYNPFHTFHVRQVSEVTGQTNQLNNWPKFWDMLASLRARSITGGAARQAILDCSAEFDDVEWNTVCRRVITKDLRCGISEKTLNKVLNTTEYKIPVFACQLAQDSVDQPKKLKGIKRLECKLDGVRVLAVVSDASCVLYSRNGKVFENFPQIATAILKQRKAFRYGPTSSGSFVLDGEIVGESFQKLMKQAHRKSDAVTDSMVYHIFDALPLAALKEGHYNAPQHKRIKQLESARSVLQEETDCLRVMNGLDVDLDTAEGHDIMRRFAEDAVAQGFEGIMIKSLDAPYLCKRSDSWLKWKPVISVDLNIVGVEPGTGRNLNRLGALICEGADGGRNIRVNVGGGFSDADRDQYWAARNQLLGHLVEVQADAVTQNQDGTYSLRFPRFLRFRDFETGEKV